MKKILTILLVVLSTLQIFSQNILTPEERKSILDELRKEILDSLRNNNITTSTTTDDSIKEIKAEPWKGNVELSAYIETYYLFDINHPKSGNRPSFIYSHNRHNEFNVNLALIKVNYTAPRLRANVALMAGTYSNANLAAEPGVLKNIYEANAGINLSKKKQLWLDAGIYASHIGFESAIGKDCWNMTRSMLSDNSPFYQSGVKLTYSSDNGKFLVAAHIINGWQRIQRVAASSLPSFGWQVQGKPTDKILINSSSFIGTDKPDSTRQMRYFHNFYAIFNATSKLAFTVGVDAGAEQKAKKSKQYNAWYSPVFIVRYAPIEILALSARVEYYSDKNAVIVATGTPNGFQTFGYSLNVDVIPFPNAMIRLEGRLYQSRKDDIFENKSGNFSKLNPTVGFSFAYAFAHQFK
ncbi:MAG TPA: porin [Chitinophagales bacterium]|nr:porin [Chitinophagales bacterium]